MERKSWLWKRKISERIPDETESCGSISSHSERYSDEQVEEEGSKSPNHKQLSPDVTSNEDVNERFKSLTEKLTAALVNVGAKEDLVKQHAKVAEEAVAGWEKAENEVQGLREELEAAVQHNLALEVRVNHLDGALKECVKQLRQAREEHEQSENEWNLTKNKLEIKLCDLQAQLEANKSQKLPPLDLSILLKLESLEKENMVLKFERDLSTQAAETASKQHLDSIHKVAKLEAECRRLARKSPSINDHSNHKAASISSIYVDSLTDTLSETTAEKINALEDIDTFNMEHNASPQSCSDSWALALIAQLDQFKNGKVVAKSESFCQVNVDNIMDDFLEMERLASFSDPQNKTQCSDFEMENHSLRTKLEEKLAILEAEKAKLESALNTSENSLAETKRRMEDLQKELMVVNESKELLEFQLVSMEVEAQAMSTKVDSLMADIEKEKSLSLEMTVKYQELEKELAKKTTEEVNLELAATSNYDLKAKQEKLGVAAADRLSECQKTISSLARQLESLATLEDFLMNTGVSSSIPKTGGELWKLHSNDTFMPKKL